MAGVEEHCFGRVRGLRGGDNLEAWSMPGILVGPFVTGLKLSLGQWIDKVHGIFNLIDAVDIRMPPDGSPE